MMMAEQNLVMSVRLTQPVQKVIDGYEVEVPIDALGVAQ